MTAYGEHGEYGGRAGYGEYGEFGGAYEAGGPQPGAGWDPRPPSGQEEWAGGRAGGGADTDAAADRPALQPVPRPQIGTPWEPAAPQREQPVPRRASEEGAAQRLDPTAFHGDPAALYEALRRAHGPVAPVLLAPDIPAWLVLGYREVHYVSANPGLFGRDPRRWNAWDRVPAGWPLLPYVAHGASVSFTEGAEHGRRAGAIADVLAGADQFELRLAAEGAADAAIDRFAGAGRAELVRQYAEQVPLRVMAGLLGLRDDETDELERDLAAAPDGGPDASAAHARTRNTMETLLERGRREPGPDVPSRLLAHPAALADEEIVQDLLTLMTDGQRRTARWIGNTLRLMLTDDRFAVTLYGGRRSVGQALTEVLWTQPPTHLVVGRWATRDTHLGGRLVRRGDCLILGPAAANTDPAVCPYPVPGLSPGATAAPAPGAVGNQAHLSFGHGEHRCPAPAPEIAETIAKAAVEVLLDRLPDLRLSVPDAEVGWDPSLLLRGPTALPVEFTPV
ncbi:cytochrome P450 [Streptomyces sp. HPF1205]|uniref:cytochrome P450 n=1 Tax=Streptomyces sp. HPF1205 TaxID=2873262 RepID=UPI001CEC4C58|nr:cytochrome P450 [Streptomyces sp. HPF1205]